MLTTEQTTQINRAAKRYATTHDEVGFCRSDALSILADLEPELVAGPEFVGDEVEACDLFVSSVSDLIARA